MLELRLGRAMPTLSLLLITAWFTKTAMADPTVIYPGDDPAMAVARVAATTKLPSETIKPVTLNDITLEKEPVLYGPGSADSCDGPSSTMKALEGAVERAEGGVAYMEYDAASANLRLAYTAMKCLSEPIRPEVGSRLHFLSGILLHANGETDAASAAYRKAHLYEPGLIWDDYFPPDSKELFDAAAVALEAAQKVTLALVPAPPEGALWINGRAVSTTSGITTLVEGDHLVQVVGGNTNTVELSLLAADVEETAEAEETADAEETAEETAEAEETTGEAASTSVTHTLVIPTAVTTTDLTWVSEDDSRKTLETILDAALGKGVTVYIPLGSNVWTTKLGTGEWTRLDVPNRALSSSIDPRKLTGRIAFWGGAGAVLGGGIMSSLQYFKATGAITDARDAESQDIWLSSQEVFDTAKEAKTTSDIILVSGVVLLGGGWVLQRGVSITPWASYGTQGLTLTLSR